MGPKKEKKGKKMMAPNVGYDSRLVLSQIFAQSNYSLRSLAMPVINSHVKFPRSTRPSSSWVEHYQDEICKFCTTNACHHASGDGRRKGWNLEGIHAIECVNDLIDELTEKSGTRWLLFRLTFGLIHNRSFTLS